MQKSAVSAPVSIIGEYSVDDGKMQPFSLEALPQDGCHHTLVVIGHFADPVEAGSVLNILTGHLRVTFSVNGKTIYSFGEDGTYPATFHSAGSMWTQVELPEMTGADTVEFTLFNFYPNRNEYSFSNFFTHLSAGQSSALYQEMLRSIALPMCLGAFVLSIGAAALVIALLKRLQGLSDSARVAAFGGFALTGGMWVITDGIFPYFSLLITNLHVFQILDVLCVLLMPIAIALVLRTDMHSPKSRRVQSLFLWSEIIAAISCLVLQDTGIADLYQTSPALSVVYEAMLLLLAASIVMELKAGDNQRFRLLLLTFLPLLLSGALEAVNTFTFFMPLRISIPCGVLLTILLQLFRLVQSTKEDAQKALEVKRMQNELAERRIAAMLSQIQPHFLYNALNTIQNLCRKDPALAGKAISSFSEYLRGNLDSLNQRGFIRFDTELAHIKHYFDIELLRFSERVKVVYGLETIDFFLPPLTVQPLVENAVRHGVTKKEEGGTVTISTRETPNDVTIIVSDDGVGFDPDVTPDDGRSHVGIANIRERLAAQCGGSLRIESSSGHGTVATITIPKGPGNENDCSGR